MPHASVMNRKNGAAKGKSHEWIEAKEENDVAKCRNELYKC